MFGKKKSTSGPRITHLPTLATKTPPPMTAFMPGQPTTTNSAAAGDEESHGARLAISRPQQLEMELEEEEDDYFEDVVMVDQDRIAEILDDRNRSDRRRNLLVTIGVVLVVALVAFAAVGAVHSVMNGGDSTSDGSTVAGAAATATSTSTRYLRVPAHPLSLLSINPLI